MERYHETLRGPGGLKLEIDSNDVFPNDPGLGTPALVLIRGCAATLACALDSGTVEHIPLTSDQIAWLEKAEDHVNRVLQAYCGA